MIKIFLASASPRRQELLQQIGLKFEVMPSNIDENIDKNEPPERIVQQLAYSKARDVSQRISEPGIVIGADTIVVHGGTVLGKPKDDREAFMMLKSLSGDVHTVFTGFSIINTYSGKTVNGYEQTLVKFREISDEDIQKYIRTGEPMDKAGAYGIQKKGSMLVDRIEGDYFNVVGLPVAKIAWILQKEFQVCIL
ncbi:MAG: septum formation inhibitor Maf [Clostridiaceae bacterium]|nr:septum formation inhibitor Maf [Clostridiaceae bacterium]